MKEKSRTSLLYFLIVTLQILCICYWAGEKANYYIDDLYSFTHTKYFPESGRPFQRFTVSDDWQAEKWVGNGILKAEMIQTEEDSLLALPFLSVLKKLALDKYNYFGFLNIVQSLIPNAVPKHMPAVILNLLFFFFTQIFIFRITEELTGSRMVPLLAAAMYGFSLFAIGMACYVRFYTMAVFLLAAVLRLHQIMRRTESIVRFELFTVLSMALLYTGIKNTQLFFILGTALIFFFTLDLLALRKYRRSCCYLVTIVPAGMYYVIRKTNFLDVIFHPEDFLTVGAESIIAKGLTNISSRRILPLARAYLKWICYQLFGSKVVFFSFIFIMALLAVLWLVRSRKEPGEKRREDGFIPVITAVTLTYIISALLGNLNAVRYISFVFPLSAILLWALADLFTREKTYRKPALLACAFLMAAGILAGELRHSDNIEYIYREDRQLIRLVGESETDTVVVIYTGASSGIEHAVYDCVNMLPDSAKLYPVTASKHRIDPSEMPDTLLIWNSVNDKKDIKTYTDDLIAAGYVISKLGSDHISVVYTARKTKP